MSTWNSLQSFMINNIFFLPIQKWRHQYNHFFSVLPLSISFFLLIVFNDHHHQYHHHCHHNCYAYIIEASQATTVNTFNFSTFTSTTITTVFFFTSLTVTFVLDCLSYHHHCVCLYHNYSSCYYCHSITISTVNLPPLSLSLCLLITHTSARGVEEMSL